MTDAVIAILLSCQSSLNMKIKDKFTALALSMDWVTLNYKGKVLCGRVGIVGTSGNMFSIGEQDNKSKNVVIKIKDVDFLVSEEFDLTTNNIAKTSLLTLVGE